MHPTVPPCLAIWPFMALAAALACAPAHAQDATKALNLLGNFLRWPGTGRRQCGKHWRPDRFAVAILGSN